MAHSFQIRATRCFIVFFVLRSIVGNPVNDENLHDSVETNEGNIYPEYVDSTFYNYGRENDNKSEEIEAEVSTNFGNRGKAYGGAPPTRQYGYWLSPWTARNREFSFTGFLESMLDVVTGGLSSIVSNVIGGDPKSRKPRTNRVSYKGHQLIRITPTTKGQVKDLVDLKDSEGEDVRFWSPPLGNKSTDILISPDIIPDVKDFLREKNIDFTVMIPDLQKTIAYQNPKMSKEQRDDLLNNQGHPMTWKRYHRFGEILKYLEYLAFRYPHLVELITIGRSFEGQPLQVVKVSSGPTKDGRTKPVLWIDAGMHAREWIGTAVATYILNQLVEKNNTYSKLLDISDWMILPVVNPDGYEFSHTGDRLWRKTRSSHADNDNEARYTPAGLFYMVSHYTKWLFSRCDGVDPNRNFGYHWGEDKEGGMSKDPCHETYAGPNAFSEPETKAMADFIMENRENIRLYLTLHSYSQMWLVPWGHTRSRPDDYSELSSVAKKAAKAMGKVHGTSYKVGPSAELLYPTSGASDDWAKGVAGIKYSYTLELRDRGTYGFLLPATQIIPTARETWAGIRTLARAVTAATNT
ncbi:carboxypeptidase B-like [Venturia canescens]|uniref:carboxypeptidase B-like n=1 Tax=Venturia canescens TaxID=32260 RepID=UPI001C9CDABB|nr:carboxypeptidase B-like [Venturia canescens]